MTLQLENPYDPERTFKAIEKRGYQIMNRFIWFFLQRKSRKKKHWEIYSLNQINIVIFLIFIIDAFLEVFRLKIKVQLLIAIGFIVNITLKHI